MRTLFFRTALLAALAGPLALLGCEKNTEVEVGPNGEAETDTDVGIDDDAEATLDSAGAALGRTGEAIQEGAENLVDSIDANVDVGANARDDD